MGHLNEAGTAAEVAARLPTDNDLISPTNNVVVSLPIAQAAAAMSVPHANGHLDLHDEPPHTKLNTSESL